MRLTWEGNCGSDRMAVQDRMLLALFIFQSREKPAHMRSIHLSRQGGVYRVLILEFLLSSHGCMPLSTSTPQEFDQLSNSWEFLLTLQSLYEGESWDVVLNYGDGTPLKKAILPLLTPHLGSLPLLAHDLSVVEFSVTKEQHKLDQLRIVQRQQEAAVLLSGSFQDADPRNRQMRHHPSRQRQEDLVQVDSRSHLHMPAGNQGLESGATYQGSPSVNFQRLSGGDEQETNDLKRLSSMPQDEHPSGLGEGSSSWGTENHSVGSHGPCLPRDPEEGIIVQLDGSRHQGMNHGEAWADEMVPSGAMAEGDEAASSWPAPSFPTFPASAPQQQAGSRSHARHTIEQVWSPRPSTARQVSRAGSVSGSAANMIPPMAPPQGLPSPSGYHQLQQQTLAAAAVHGMTLHPVGALAHSQANQEQTNGMFCGLETGNDVLAPHRAFRQNETVRTDHGLPNGTMIPLGRMPSASGSFPYVPAPAAGLPELHHSKPGGNSIGTMYGAAAAPSSAAQVRSGDRIQVAAFGTQLSSQSSALSTAVMPRGLSIRAMATQRMRFDREAWTGVYQRAGSEGSASGTPTVQSPSSNPFASHLGPHPAQLLAQALEELGNKDQLLSRGSGHGSNNHRHHSPHQTATFENFQEDLPPSEQFLGSQHEQALAGLQREDFLDHSLEHQSTEGHLQTSLSHFAMSLRQPDLSRSQSQMGFFGLQMSRSQSHLGLSQFQMGPGYPEMALRQMPGLRQESCKTWRSRSEPGLNEDVADRPPVDLSLDDKNPPARHLDSSNQGEQHPCLDDAGQAAEIAPPDFVQKPGSGLHTMDNSTELPESLPQLTGPAGVSLMGGTPTGGGGEDSGQEGSGEFCNTEGDGEKEEEMQRGEGEGLSPLEDDDLPAEVKEKLLEGATMTPTERLAGMTLVELSKFFDRPINQACKELKVGLTVLKKKCRDFGVPRWPHRKMKSLDSLIQTIQDLAKGPEGKTIETVKSAVEELQNQKRALQEIPGTELAERTKKLRQACFKASYKRRRYANHPTNRGTKSAAQKPNSGESPSGSWSQVEGEGDEQSDPDVETVRQEPSPMGE